MGKSPRLEFDCTCCFPVLRPISVVDSQLPAAMEEPILHDILGHQRIQRATNINTERLVHDTRGHVFVDDAGKAFIHIVCQNQSSTNIVAYTLTVGC